MHLHFHMLFLDGVYVEGPDGALSFRWVKAPTGAELTALASRIARGRGGSAQAAAETDDRTPTAMSWPQRLKRVFGIDIETCPACVGAMRIIACIEDPAAIEKILAHLDAKAAAGQAAQPPPCRASPARPLG